MREGKEDWKVDGEGKVRHEGWGGECGKGVGGKVKGYAIEFDLCRQL